MLQNLINHVSLIVDKSSSMDRQPVVRVFDEQLQRLKVRSEELNQETRISIYLFADRAECLAFDMDVMRFKSLDGYWKPNGWTALIDAVLLSIKDHETLPTSYGDHAFLQYVITDGQENRSLNSAQTLRTRLEKLSSNWTSAALVPNREGVIAAQRLGFYPDSIAQWDTASRVGLENVGKQFSSVMDNYMTMRSTGVRGTKGLFTLDSSGLNAKAVKQTLQEVDPDSYQILPVRKESPIKEYVESWLKSPYRMGSAYYQPTKPVEIQHYKKVLLQDTRNGRVYEGNHLRQLLGLPDQTAKVNPGDHNDWRIFVQSTSVNRKLYPGTFLLIRN